LELSRNRRRTEHSEQGSHFSQFFFPVFFSWWAFFRSGINCGGVYPPDEGAAPRRIFFSGHSWRSC
jgi:hypothetical protein